MKICVFDPNCNKFTDDMVEHWTSQGHEVQRTLYYDPAMVRWADVIWFETCDNNLAVATMSGEAGWKLSEIDMTNKHVICRVIDIEAWCGLHKNVDWSYVDDVIFLAPHIWELVEKDVDFSKTKTNMHLIPCGVNMDKFPLRKNIENTNKIAWVSERWHGKGIDYFLQYAAMLYKHYPQYKIYAVGIWADDASGGWYKAYIDQFMLKNKMNVEFIDRVDDMNEFLEDKSHCICFSKKETFSYAIAEGMSKGLKPLIHDFYGADAIWDEKYRWELIEDAFFMTANFIDYEPSEYRQYIEDNYSSKIMLDKFDKIIKKEN